MIDRSTVEATMEKAGYKVSFENGVMVASLTAEEYNDKNAMQKYKGAVEQTGWNGSWGIKCETYPTEE